MAPLPLLHLVLGLLLAGWTLLFLFRIVLTWYPGVDLTKGVMRLVGAPTEPVLVHAVNEVEGRQGRAVSIVVLLQSD